MGVHSTVIISKKNAVNLIVRALDDVENISNEQLEGLLFELFGDKCLCNFTIAIDNDPNIVEFDYPT